MREIPNGPVARAEMLIRRPVAEVFEAFVNPSLTSRFWFSKGSGRLEAGKGITWDWEMYDFSVQVNVKALEKNARILVEWSAYNEPTLIEWIFGARPDGTTFVTVTNRDFPGSEAEAMRHALEATEGFALVLAGAKAFLEYGVQLNLVPDRFPKDVAQPVGEVPDSQVATRKSTRLPEKPEDWPRVFERHLNAGDVDAVMALYEPMACFVAPSGETLIGHQQMRKVIGGMIAARTRLHGRVVRLVTVDDIAHLSTDFEGTRIDESGKTVSIRSKAIEILRRQPGGGWKLIVGNPHGRE